jgi:hypothetical protein
MILGASKVQAALYYNRRKRLARKIIGGLTPWRASLAVTQGHFVQNADMAYQAVNGGTTGATPPTHTQGQASDGVVTWQRVDSRYMLKYLFSGAPSP